MKMRAGTADWPSGEGLRLLAEGSVVCAGCQLLWTYLFTCLQLNLYILFSMKNLKQVMLCVKY